MKSPFESHVKRNVLEVERGQYIHPNDPMYIVKLMRYNQKSAHFHYTLGQEHEKEKRYSKALFHYIEAIRVHSPYYFKAKASLLDLERKMAEETGVMITKRSEYIESSGHPFQKALIVLLTLSNLTFILLLVWQGFRQ